MSDTLWRQYIDGALASRHFGAALEICLRALADLAPEVHAGLKTLVDELDRQPAAGAVGAGLLGSLARAEAGLARLDEHLRLTASVIAAAGGPRPPDLGGLEPERVQAAARQARDLPDGRSLARHRVAIRRAAYRAAGHLGRLLEEPAAEADFDLSEYALRIHQALAACLQSRRLLAASLELFED